MRLRNGYIIHSNKNDFVSGMACDETMRGAALTMVAAAARTRARVFMVAECGLKVA